MMSGQNDDDDDDDDDCDDDDDGDDDDDDDDEKAEDDDDNDDEEDDFAFAFDPVRRATARLRHRSSNVKKPMWQLSYLQTIHEETKVAEQRKQRRCPRGIKDRCFGQFQTSRQFVRPKFCFRICHSKNDC